MTETITRQILRYCQYQERCHKEVRTKLAELGCYGKDADELIAYLVEHNHLNESRFASAFARGKFRMLKWGRQKIRYELKQRNITPYIITKAMNEIPEEDYVRTMEQLIDRRLATLPERTPNALKMRQITVYMQRKGYETDLTTDMLSTKLNSK